MKLKDIISTSSSNLLRSKVRTLLTVLAIFVGAFTLTLTSAMGAGITSYVDAQLGNLGQESTLIIQPDRGEPTSPSEPALYDPDANLSSGGGGGQVAVLSSEDLETLEDLDAVQDVEPIVPVAPAYIVGEGEKYKLTLSPVMADLQFDLLAGSSMKKNDAENKLVLPEAFVAAMGYDTPEEIVGETLQLGIADSSGNIEELDAVVSGVMAPGILAQAGPVVNDALRDELYAHQTLGLPDAAKEVYLAAFATLSGEYTDEKMSNAKEEINDLGFVSSNVDDQLGIFDTVINVITYVLNGFALIALLAAGFGIVNTLLMSVQERTREIGLMKAMGMSERKIFTLFSVEAVLIGFWGSVVGILGSMAVGFSINSVLSEGILKDLPGLNLFAYPPSVVLFTMVLIMAVAFAAGALPARRASKLDPIDALRYE